MNFRALLRLALLGLSLFSSLPASAWILTLTAGTKQLYLEVGLGTQDANNATVNLVSLTVPAANVGDGNALAMTSDSTQSISYYDNYVVCNPPAQVYVGGSYRQPNNTTGAASATLQVTTPTNLTSGTDTVPFSQISWTSTANGNTTADLPAGTFTGTTQALANIGRNTFVENCYTYSYKNQSVVAAGTFTGRATFTLAVP